MPTKFAELAQAFHSQIIVIIPGAIEPLLQGTVWGASLMHHPVSHDLEMVAFALAESSAGGAGHDCLNLNFRQNFP